jgi:putative MATE family efflux protein
MSNTSDAPTPDSSTPGKPSSAGAPNKGDLTQGPVLNQLLGMAAPIAIGMILQTMYFLIDLYFVSRLGEAAVAGVSAAGNLSFVILGITQMLSIGMIALIAQAVGRKDEADANLIFNQSVSLGALLTVVILAAGYLAVDPYMRAMAASPESAAAGRSYLLWFIPSLALQVPMTVLASGMRGAGIAKPTMIVQAVSVLINAVLAPVLVAGWLTGKPMGVAGAGLASTLAASFGVVMLYLLFKREHLALRFGAEARSVQTAVWGRILKVGVPAGGEFGLMFIYLGTIYLVTSKFGAEAQAGFGIGMRVMQAMFLPVMAVSFAIAPVAGQNFGAGLHDRVRETFRVAAWVGSVMMLLLTVIAHVAPEVLLGIFTKDARTIAFGTEYLTIVSYNFLASGLVFSISGMFQGMGHTVPALISSASRIVTFVLPALFLSTQSWFGLRHLWYLSVASVLIQLALSAWLLRREFATRLKPVGVA